jgi:multisubunit Na+/H+ antiporter MnhG subunit
MSWRHVLATVLLVGGCSLQVWAVVGLVVLRNAYDRLHCLGLAGYGALLAATAIVVRQSFSLIGDKALLTGLVLVLFGPVLAHTTARSLRIREHGDWRAGIERHRENEEP